MFTIATCRSSRHVCPPFLAWMLSKRLSGVFLRIAELHGMWGFVTFKFNYSLQLFVWILLEEPAFWCQMTRVYVGNLGKNGSRRELEREFERFGPLRDVWVARNPPGFAFVLFEDARDAEDACHDMDGRYICGEKIRVEMARGPNRGGRASRMSFKEKCYECGRVGHFARACTRRPGNYSRDRGDRRRRSRSRSPRWVLKLTYFSIPSLNRTCGR